MHRGARLRDARMMESAPNEALQAAAKSRPRLSAQAVRPLQGGKRGSLTEGLIQAFMDFYFVPCRQL